MWHARTRFYEEALRLRDDLRVHESTIAELQGELERSRGELEALQAEIARVRSGGQATTRSDEPSLDDPGTEGSVASTDARLSDLTDRFAQERDRLLGDVRDGKPVGVEDRRKLLDFLLDALKQVERIPSNGAAAAPASEGETRRVDAPGEREQAPPPADPAAEGTNVAPPTQ